MKFSRIAAIASLGVVALATGAKATPYNFAVAVAFTNVAAVTSTGASAAANLASAVEFTFTPAVVYGPNGQTTGSPTTSDTVLAGQLIYPTYLSRTSLGLAGTGGTTTYGGTNSYYFFNFSGPSATTASLASEAASVGGFETRTGSVVVATNTESANFLDVTLTGIFAPSTSDATLGYVNTPATLHVDFTSTCSGSNCSVSGSGTLAVGSFNTVPEPATLALLGTGVLGLGLVLRRKSS